MCSIYIIWRHDNLSDIIQSLQFHFAIKYENFFLTTGIYDYEYVFKASFIESGTYICHE